VPRTRSDTFRIVAAIGTSFLLAASAPAFAAPDKSAALVVDANTGKTLYAHNADSLRYPASLTKMMTLYVLFEELSAKRLSLNSLLTVSATAAAQPPSKLGIRAGGTIRVEDAILALTTRSANDMAIAIAENISGSVPAFAARMNRTARALGMSSTTYRNPNGLPDPGQTTTARDLVKLGRALQDNFPAYYRYFGVRSFVFAGRRIGNHNHLLGSVQGVDGIKTGYTRASGFNLVTNVNRDGRHLIAVVMGGRSAGTRDGQMRQLIATYLPAAKPGVRKEAVLAADAGEPTKADTITDAADDDSEDGAPAEGTQVAVAAQPRPRPDQSAQTAPSTRASVDDLAYASASRPASTPPAEAAMMALSAKHLPSSAKPRPSTRPVVAQGDTSDTDDDLPADPIAQRISAASQVAELAFAEPAASRDDPLVKLAAIARKRASEEQQVAVAMPSDVVRQKSAPAASPSRESSWLIQIGAFPTKAGANAVLSKARRSLGSRFAAVHPTTEPVKVRRGFVYRARFVGFADKDQARAACAELHRRRIKCLAVPN
jgi:D-alanyl-D-alanine carboxypeptidase